MGRNDWHVGRDGKLVNGLATPSELLGLVDEIDDALLSNELANRALAQLNKNRAQEQPMLKGKGFVVVNPKEKYIQSEEFENLDDARAAASDMAYQQGVAIIYAPFEVVRPDRPVIASTPSALMQQIVDTVAPKPPAVSAGTPSTPPAQD